MLQPFINWQSDHYLQEQQIAPWMREWLLERNSMTQKLRKHCTQVTIHLIRQDWTCLSETDCQRLGFNEPGPTLVREVSIICDHHVWMYAGTFVSKKHLSSIDIKTLGNRPLGELLFKNQRWQRVELDFADLKSGSYKFEFLNNALQQDALVLWARRSYFTKKTDKLMLIELFTPHMWDTLLSKLSK